jgi:cysteinyl-tRNA synthetase
MDLLFPHHECELAQNTAARGEGGVRYWMHNNMITINGQKMGKSLGNFITLEELFKGEHRLLTQPFSPMTIRFFILQAHYRSTLDFSNDALVAAEKGYKRMMAAASEVKSLKTVAGNTSAEIKLIEEGVMTALLDDMNTPVAVAYLFDAVRIVNSVKDGLISISQEDKETLSAMFYVVVKEILGLADEKGDGDKGAVFSGVMEMILEMRREAKVNKEFAKSDAIRERLNSMGISIKDTKEGTEWYL